MLAILTFLASAPGGALLGFVMDILAERRQGEREKKQADRDTRLAELNHLKEYAALLDKTTPGDLKPVTHRIKLGNWEYAKTKYKMYPTNFVSPRARVVAASLFVLVITYCLIALIFAIDPAWVINTIDPDGDPVKVNLLIFRWEWTPRKPVVLNAGGAAFYMASALIFTISTAIVGTARRLAR